jgi:hypothetical protein
MKHLYCALSALMTLLVSVPTLATTYVVTPDGTGDFPTIQAAVDAVLDGDIIELTDGTFTGVGNRDIQVYPDLAATVKSQSGNPEVCIIDCEQLGRGFFFLPGSGSHFLLEGIKIVNGDGGGTGGGIMIGHYGVAPSPTIRNCVFENNSAFVGGGVFLSAGEAIIGFCLFVDNRATDGNGGGISSSVATPTISNCTFVWNEATTGGGGLCAVHSASHPMVDRCIFVANEGGAGGAPDAVDCHSGGSVTLTCCDICGHAGGDWVGCIAGQYGINGNFSADPMFCDPNNGDFTLHCDSPCLPGNHPHGDDCGLIGARDMGCGATPIIPTRWGEVKALFR